jgi:DtxR family Mn-dependent transcriptional regulator
MYLITVAMAVEEGHKGPVPVPHLADALSVSRVSANEMVKKLAGRDLLEYVPYQGVVLTTDGAAIADEVLRRRRLWAVFLAEHLGLPPTAADEVACEFEHVTPGEVEERLAAFLGDPTVGPQGKPIPTGGVRAPTRRELVLTDMTVGQEGRVVRNTADTAMRSFLEEEGLGHGALVTLLAIGEDRGCLVDTGHGHAHLAAAVAEHVVVTPSTR